jgi:hypothetical protein
MRGLCASLTLFTNISQGDVFTQASSMLSSQERNLIGAWNLSHNSATGKELDAASLSVHQSATVP